MKEYYAHSIEGKPKSEWQGLEEHLKGTAELAKNSNLLFLLKSLFVSIILSIS